jgi:glycine reductase complex component B subunit gamma
MAQKLRIVHYVNQFFGGIGGEEKASEKPQVKDGCIGPGRAIQNALEGKGDVVATIICGDNYIAERTDEAIKEIIQLLIPYKPDVVIAGPAFNAGRYGVGCGAICKAVQEKMGIPAVTGMFEKNPGVGLYRMNVYIINTLDSVRGMTDAVSRMVNLAMKMATQEKIGSPEAEYYIPRGILKAEMSDKTAAQRAVDMIVKKAQGQPFTTELHLFTEFERVKPPAAIKNLSSAKIALATDGGLVPKGNPDKIELNNATRWGEYSVKGLDSLNPENFEVTHSGYDNTAVRKDPNRLVPLDAARDFEKNLTIGKLNDSYFATTGVLTTFENARRMGREIAQKLKAEGVDGVILTST